MIESLPFTGRIAVAVGMSILGSVVYVSGLSLHNTFESHLRLTGISRLWTWTLDPETVDFGLDFSPEHTAKIALG